MLKKFKRPVSILLAVLMVAGLFTAFPLTASAGSYNNRANTLDYEVNEAPFVFRAASHLYSNQRVLSQTSGYTYENLVHHEFVQDPARAMNFEPEIQGPPSDLVTDDITYEKTVDEIKTYLTPALTDIQNGLDLVLPYENYDSSNNIYRTTSANPPTEYSSCGIHVFSVNPIDYKFYGFEYDAYPANYPAIQDNPPNKNVEFLPYVKADATFSGSQLGLSDDITVYYKSYEFTLGFEGSNYYSVVDPQTTPFFLYKSKFIAGHSITAGSDVGVNFYIDPFAAGVEPGQTATLKVDFEWAKNPGENPLVDIKSQSTTVMVTPDNYKKIGDYIPVTCNVCAAEMSCDIKATVTLNGKTATDNYCVQDYLNTVFEYDILIKVTSKNISPKAKKYGIIEPTNKVGDLDAVESICRR